MDCCGEYRAHPHAHGYAPAGWEYAPYAPLPYNPYYPPLQHDPYRYYRYDYAHHAHRNEHAMPMDYGAYAAKEARVPRAVARREARALTPSHQIPLPHTPPLECGMGRPTYCEPQMWPHYQMGMGGGWSNANGSAWAARNAFSREHMRYATEGRPIKSSHHSARQMLMQEGRSTPYPMYEEPSYGMESSVRARHTPETPTEACEALQEPREPQREPPEEPRPPVVPLPAFQQAFGSTEIGKFSEAFSRTELPVEDGGDGFAYDAFPEWDASDPQWSTPPAPREIKCEDNF